MMIFFYLFFLPNDLQMTVHSLLVLETFVS